MEEGLGSCPLGELLVGAGAGGGVLGHAHLRENKMRIYNFLYLREIFEKLTNTALPFFTLKYTRTEGENFLGIEKVRERNPAINCQGNPNNTHK